MDLKDRQSNEVKRLLRSFHFAWTGIRQTFKTERNFQIHCMMSMIVITVALIVELSKLEWIIILFLIGGILSLELINTALEKTIDLITSEYHPLAKMAKDAAAGAVFIYTILAVIIGFLIFFPKIFL